jgi:hypothetical protein
MQDVKHSHKDGICSDGECDRAPVAVKGENICRCENTNKDAKGKCIICGFVQYASWELELIIGSTEHGDKDPLASCQGDGQDDYGNPCTGYSSSLHPCTKCSALGANTSRDIVELSAYTSMAEETEFEYDGVLASSIRMEGSTLKFKMYHAVGKTVCIPGVLWYTLEDY